VRIDRKKREKMAVFSILSPVRLPFRHTGGDLILAKGRANVTPWQPGALAY
jgi:hypothetical protein